MNFEKYINLIDKPVGFKPTGITKEYYLDVIEACVNVYKKEELEISLLKYEDKIIDDIQVYSRVASAIGILLANGRKKDFGELWNKMMDACCRDLCRKTGDVEVDFSVKEIMLSYMAMKGNINFERKEV